MSIGYVPADAATLVPSFFLMLVGLMSLRNVRVAWNLFGWRVEKRKAGTCEGTGLFVEVDTIAKTQMRANDNAIDSHLQHKPRSMRSGRNVPGTQKREKTRFTSSASAL